MSKRLQELARELACGGSYKKMPNGGNIFDKINEYLLGTNRTAPNTPDRLTYTLDNIIPGGGAIEAQDRRRFSQNRKPYMESLNNRQVVEPGMTQVPRESTLVNQQFITSDTPKMKKGGIHIKPSKRGTFTAAATKHGMGVQEFARHVLANKDKFSGKMRKKANFARTASKFKHEFGGEYLELGGFLQEIAPLISAIPGAQPVGMAAGLLGQLLPDKQPDIRIPLKQMQNGGDPPLGVTNPPKGSPAEKLAHTFYKRMLNTPGGLNEDVLKKKQDHILTMVDVVDWKRGLQDPTAVSKVDEFLTRYNETGDIADMGVAFSMQHAIEKAKDSLKGVGWSGKTYNELRDMKRGYKGKVAKKQLGGDFKQYSAPSHAEGGMMIDQNGNPTAANPVAEIEKGENSYKGYVYSDHLVNANTGNTFAKDAKKIARQTRRNDDISKTSRILQLARLKSANDMSRVAKQANDTIPLAQDGIELPNPYNKLNGYFGTPQFVYNEATGQHELSPELPPQPVTAPIVDPTTLAGFIGGQASRAAQNAAYATGAPSTAAANLGIGATTTSTLPSTTDNVAGPATTNPGLSKLNKVAAGLKGASLAFGAVDALRGAEREKLQLPDYSRGDEYYRGLEVDLAPALAEINMATTKGIQDVSNQASGIGARNSRINSILARAGKSAAQTQLQQSQANAGIRAQIGSREDMKAQTVAGERIRQQTAQSQNEATNRLAARKFFSDLSQVGTTLNSIQYMNDAMKNQNELGRQAIQYGLTILGQKYPNFKPDPAFFERLQNGTLTDADKPLVDQLIKFYKEGQ